MKTPLQKPLTLLIALFIMSCASPASSNENRQYAVISQFISSCAAAFTAASELVEEQDKPGYVQHAFLYAVAASAMLGIEPRELEQHESYSQAYFAFFEKYQDEESRETMIKMVRDCFQYQDTVNEVIAQARKAMTQQSAAQ